MRFRKYAPFLLVGAVLFTGCGKKDEVKVTTVAPTEAVTTEAVEPETEAVDSTDKLFEGFVSPFPELVEVKDAEKLTTSLKEANTVEALLKKYGKYKIFSGHPSTSEDSDSEYEYSTEYYVDDGTAHLVSYNGDEEINAIYVSPNRILVTENSLEDEPKTALVFSSILPEELKSINYWLEEINPVDYGTLYKVEEDGDDRYCYFFTDMKNIDEDGNPEIYRSITKFSVDSENVIHKVEIMQYNSKTPDVELNGGLGYVVEFTYDNADDPLFDYINTYEAKEQTDVTLQVRGLDGEAHTYTEKAAIGEKVVISPVDTFWLLSLKDDMSEIDMLGEFEVTKDMKVYAEEVDEARYEEEYNKFISNFYGLDTVLPNTDTDGDAVELESESTVE